MKRNTPEKPHYQAIIWLNMEEALEPLEENEKLSIQRSSTNRKNDSPWFLSANVKKLKRKLGSSYADYKPRLAMLHQNIVTMEVLEKSHDQNVIYVQDANEAINEISKIKENDGKKGNNNKKKVMAFMHYNQAVHVARFAKMYDRMTHNVDEFYPTRDENIWEQSKLHDIRILDQIAEREGEWRPTTCERMEGRKCALEKEAMTIYKRTHSCAGGHVFMVRKNQLKCGPGQPQSPAVATPTTENGKRIHEFDDMYGNDYYTWFHQTFVPGLQLCEIRVFIATRPKKEKPVTRTRIARKAKKSKGEEQENESTREPYIIQIVDTSFPEKKNTDLGKKEDKKKESKKEGKKKQDKRKKGKKKEDEEKEDEDKGDMIAVAIDRDFKWSLYPELTYDMVERFALEMFGFLKETNSKGFASLEVGVRLDLGVAEDGTSLWVNEITRWYAADHFAYETGTFEKIPRAYAKAFAEVYPTPKREALNSDGQDPDSNSRRKRRKVK